MNILTTLKSWGLFLVFTLIINVLTAQSSYGEPDSYDTLSVCRSELPLMYDTVRIDDSGDFLIVFASSMGTDSVVSLHVDVHENPQPHIAGSMSFCVNDMNCVYLEESYAHILWNTGSENYYILTSDTACSVMVTDDMGCTGTDSVIFEIIPLPDVVVTGETALCYQDTTMLYASGAEYYYWNRQIGGSISYSDTLMYVASEGNGYADTLFLRGYSDRGCVKMIPIYITVYPEYQSVDTMTVCHSELPYHYHGNDYSEAGTYPVHLQSVFGCDSLVMMTFVVLENPDVRILGVDSLCEGQITAITASGAVSYRWNNQSTAMSIVAYPGQLYWLEGIGSNNCTARDSMFVRLLPLPVVNINEPSEICYGQSTTISVTDGYMYSWSTGENTSSITVQPIENTDYQVIVTNQHACTSSAATSVTVYPVYETSMNVTVCSNDLPYQYANQSYSQAGDYDIHFTSIHGCDSLVHLHLAVNESPYALISGEPEICPGASTQLSTNFNGPIRWSTGATRSPITVNTPGWYVLTVTAPNGCKAYDSVEVTHLPLPDVTISGDSMICSGSQAMLTASGAYSYSWNTGVGGSVLTVYPTQTSTYVVTGTSDRNCTATAIRQVRVNAVPTANIIGTSDICQGSSTTFTATGGNSYLWSTEEVTASIQVSQEQLYTVEVTNQYGCTATASKYLNVNNLPTVSILGQNSFCEGSNTVLYASGTGNNVSYIWNNTTPGQSYTVTQPGYYTVVATSSDNCTATASISVSQNSSPEISVSGALTFCDGGNTQLTATGGQEYSWRNVFGVLIANTASVIISDGGAYTVIATDNYGCSATQQVSVVKKNIPNVEIVASDNEVCEGTPVNLYSGWSSSYTYRWNTGATSRQIVVHSSGVYVLQVTSSNGCQATDSIEVSYLPLPDVAITGANSICLGSGMELVASGASSYTWNTGSHSTVLNDMPSQTTTYTVTGVSSSGCSATATHTVVVNAVPTVSINGVEAICQDETTIYTANGGNHYLWSTGDTTASIQVSNAQSYTVEASNQFGCTATASKNLVVNSLPSVSIVGQNYFCEGSYTVLSASGTGNVSYIWNNTTAGQSYTVSNPGVYTVKAVTTAGCTSTASVTVSQESNPVLTISGELSFCDGQSTQLVASGGQSYSWRNSYDVQISNEESVSLSEGGSYFVVATNANSCTAAQQVVVTKKPLPGASIVASDNGVCEGTPVTLSTGLSSGYSYLWSTGATDRQIVINTAGKYRLQVTANGCTATDSVTITMYPLPVISFTGDTMICRGSTTLVYASAPNTSRYQWTTGAMENYISVNPNVTTTYGVTATNIYGCVNQKTVRIIVEDSPEASITGVDSICVGGSAVLQASGGLNYFWDNGTTSSERVINEAGTYTVVVYTAAGCSATALKTVGYYANPEIAITGARNLCLGDSVILTVHGGKNYLWSDASADTNIVVSESGVYTVEGWDIHNCSAKDSVEVNVLPLPFVRISGDTVACPGVLNVLTAESPTAVSYLWNDSTTSAQLNVNETGLYTVAVSDSNTCKNTASFLFELLPVPECTIEGPSSICQGDTAILTASNGTAFLWSTMDSTQSIRIYPNETTTYVVSIIDTNGCIATISKDVMVKAYMPIAIDGLENFCDGDSVLLVAHSEGELVWSNGHMGDSIWVFETGDYSVWSQDSVACMLSSSKHVEKHALPNVHIEGDTYLCVGNIGTIHAVANEDVSYLWTNGSVDSVINISSTNVYGVTVTNRNGCSKTAEQLVMVYSNPTVSINGPESICNGDDATLSVTSNANSFLWSTGDSLGSITVRPRFTTIYSVTATNNFGCTATATYSLNVVPVPMVNISGDTVLCQGEVGVLTCSNASGFHWSTGANTRSINVSTTGTYTVVATNSAGCTNSASIHVQVYEYPQLMILGDTVLCRGEQTVLTAVGGSEYLWNDGTTTPYLEVSPENNTSYTVQTVNAMCPASATVNVIVHELPDAHIEAPEGLCPGSSITLIAQGGLAYLWSTGQSVAMIEVNTSGTYQLIAYNQYGCTDTAIHTVIQYPQPQVSITGASAICEGGQDHLTVVGDGSLLWNTGDTSATIIIHQAGLYYVQSTNNQGCTATATHTVASLATPTITILGPTDICATETVNLSAVCSNAATYLWSTGATSSSVEVSPAETTTYTVIVVSSDNCSAVKSHTIAVHHSFSQEYNAEICQGHPYTGYGFNIPVQSESGTFTYTDSCQTVYGCDSVRVLHLTVKAIPVFSSAISGNSTINVPGNYVYMIDPVENANSYEWLLSNPNWNLNYNQTIAQVTILNPGIATLSAYALNECGQSLPISMQISYTVGIDDLEMTAVKVFPNPTDGMVNVQLTMTNEQWYNGEVQLMDMYGKLLNRWEMNGNDKQLDLSEYAAGVYMLKLRDTHNSLESVVKVVKQ